MERAGELDFPRPGAVSIGCAGLGRSLFRFILRH